MKRYKKTFIITSFFLFIFLFLWMFIINSGFHIVKVSPGRTLPTSTNQVLIDFNKELTNSEQQPMNAIEIFPKNVSETTINGKQVKVRFLTTFEENVEVKIHLNSLEATNEETISEEIVLTTKYVPFNKLPKDEQERQINESSIVGDEHPLISKLPHDEITFRIDYVINKKKFGRETNWKQEKNNFGVIIKTFALKDGVKSQAYKDKTLKIRRDALDWIREIGVNPDFDINVSFSPSDSEL